MPNTTVRAAAEGMPNFNRRRLLLGLAAASTAAAAMTAAPTAHSAPLAENPTLVQLGNALPDVGARYVAARDTVTAIIKEWSARWPAAPKVLIGSGYKQDFTFAGHAIFSKDKYGENRPQTIATADGLQWNIDFCRRVLKGRTIDKHKIRGMTRAEWQERLSDLLALQKAATKLEAKRDAVTKASGIVAAKEARRAAFERLADTVMETMGQDASTMGGVVIKALALDAWSRHADLAAIVLTPGASTWGQDLAASVLRLAGEA